MGTDRLELIVVDDGSTDATGTLLDTFAQSRPWVRVIHQANSGGAGGPRNVGIDLARGTYLFFLDGDDYLGTEALERLVALAERFGSDIVSGRRVGVDGRPSPDGITFRRTIGRADLAVAASSGSVLKLFRTSFLRASGIRFTGGVAEGEDADFIFQLYPLARTISILGGYACYYARRRPGSLTMTGDPLYDLTGVLERIERYRIVPIAGGLPPGARRNDLVRPLLVRVADRFDRRWLDLPPAQRSAALEVATAIMARWGSPAIVRTMPPPSRIRAWCLQQGLAGELADIADAGVGAVYDRPRVEGRRIFANYPHFRDGSGIPDHVFEITNHVWLETSIQRVALQDGILAIAGTARLTLVGGVPSASLRRWPGGRTIRLAPEILPTPEARDGARSYPRSGFAISADLALADGGGPLGSGTWEITVGASVPGFDLQHPARLERPARERQAATGPLAQQAAPVAAGERARLVTLQDARIRVRVGRIGLRDRVLEAGLEAGLRLRAGLILGLLAVIQRTRLGQAALKRAGLGHRRMARSIADL